jgi:anti-sigma regulatory factor (Ser/Thr protein kinase)
MTTLSASGLNRMNLPTRPAGDRCASNLSDAGTETPMQYGGGEVSNPQVNALDEASVSELTFALEDLSLVRRMVESAAFEAGLPAARVGEMVLAVHEVATNAVIHGRPPARLRVWKADGEIIFEVSDAGEGIADATAGNVRPSPRALSGRGLWLTRLLSDAVEVGNGDGCTVSIHASAPAPH